MGQCVLSFDQMEILNKKSDLNHSDNDWMIIYWFVSGKLARTDQFPLYNTAGSLILDTANAIKPFTREIACADNEFVTATFQVINLGSTDSSKQAQTAENVAVQVAKDIASAYLTAAELVVSDSGIPLADVFADGIDKLAPTIVSSVGATFEDVILPLLNDVIDTIAGLLGKPNCNGDILHDTVVFLPGQTDELTISKVYTASSISFCGFAARTSVQLTLERILDPVPLFTPSQPTPLPEVNLVPAKDEPLDAWLGTWAEDSTTSTPIIVVNITRSTASGLLEADITEHVDRRFDATFVASNATLSPHNKKVLICLDDVFAHIRPWTNLPVNPANVHVQIRVSTHTTVDGTAKKMETSLPTFHLLWNRPLQVGAGIPLSSLLKDSVQLSHFPTASLFPEQVEALELINQGATLCLYRFLVGNKVIGHVIRYIRDENLSFTRADVMLVPWSPVR